MKKRSKILVSLAMFVLSVGMLVFGVWSAGAVTFNVTSNITFNPSGIFVGVKGQVLTGTDLASLTTAESMDNGEERTNFTEGSTAGAEIADWAPVQINFSESLTIVQYKFEFFNHSSYPIGVTVVAGPTATTSDVIVESKDMSDVGYILPEESEVCTITYTLTKFNKPANVVLDLAFTVDKATPPTFNEGGDVVDGVISSYKGDAKVVVIPSEVTNSNGETVTVTTIGKESFQQNTAIQELTIPDTVTTIEQDAFRWCDNLKTVYLGAGVGVEDIIYVAELNPDGTSVLANYPTMFGCCYNLEQIIVSEDNPYLKSGPDNKSLLTKDGKTLLVGTKYFDIPAGVETIAQSAFYGQYYALEGVSTITIPDTVTEIGGYAFYNVGLYNEPVDVVLPSTLTTLGGGAFRKANIKSVEFNSVVDIPANAFSECDDLKTVNIQDGITSIGYGAFDSCALEFENNELVIPNSVQTIGARAFLSAYGDKYRENNASVTPLKITLPNSLQKIEQYAFGTSASNSVVVSEFVMPVSVTEVKNFAFKDLIVENFVYAGTFADWAQITFESASVSPFTYYLTDTSNYENIYFTVNGNRERQLFAYEGYTLTRMDKVTFSAMNPIVIEIPEGVRKIAEYVFYNKNIIIEKVIIPESVTEFGNYAFGAGNTGTKTLIKNIEYKGTVDKWAQLTFASANANPMNNQKTANLGGYFKFADFDSSTTKVLEIGTTGSTKFAINTYSFAYEYLFPYIKIGANVTDIKASAFNTAAADVIVPASLASIQEKAFASFAGTLCCLGSSANAGWVEGWDTKKDATKINVTYNFDLNWLETKLDPANAMFIFSGSKLTKIDYTAFDGADYVEIVIPEGVTEIEKQVFYNVAGMPAVIDRIVFPSTLQSFGIYMFKTAKYIGVEFNGTPEQWSQIDFPDNYSNIFNHIDYTNASAYVRLGEYDSRTTNLLEIGVSGSEEFTIKTRTFRYLNKFDTIVIGSKVIGIEASAFAYCDSASGEPTINIYVNSSVETLGASVFGYSYAILNFEADGVQAGWDASWSSNKKGSNTINYGVTYTAA